MGGTHRSGVGYDQIFGLLARRFREDNEDITREPLPTRWVELILHLDEQERAALGPSRPAVEREVVEAELAISRQETLLRELIRTEEPTDETRALLEDLRRRVAQAVAERD